MLGYIGSTTCRYSCTVLMLTLLLPLTSAADEDDIATSIATSTDTRGAPLTFSTNGYAEKMLSMTSLNVESDATIPLTPANNDKSHKIGPVKSRGLFPDTFALSNAGNTFTDRKAIGFVTLRDVIPVYNATFLEEIPKSITSLRHAMPEGEIQTKTSTDTRVRDRLPQSSTTGRHDMPEDLPTSRYTLSQSHATLSYEIPVSQENIWSKTPEPNSTASDETQKSRTASDKPPEVDHQTQRVEPSSGDPYTLTVRQNYTGRQPQTVWLDSGEQYTVTVRQNDTLAVTLTHCSVRQNMYLVNMMLPEDVNFTFHSRTDREWNAPRDVSCRPSPKARPIGFLYEQAESDVVCRTEAYSWFENGRIMHSYCIVSTDVVIGVGKTRIIIGKPTEPRIRKYSRALEMTFSLTTMSMTSKPMMTSSQLIHFTFISHSNGYFMSPVYHGVIDGWPLASSYIESAFTITLPDDDHVVMLSAVEANHYRAQCICGPVNSCQMQKSTPEVTSNTLEIRYGQTLFTYLVLSGTCPIKADVYHNNLMISFNGHHMISCVQFKYKFSFHPVSERPSKLANGLFNCSVPHYASFKQYLQCNMEPECHGGEDERDCPYNHKDCVGSFGDGTSCYKYTIWHKKLSWLQADEVCNNLGGRLPNLANQTKRDTFNRLFQTGSRWWWPVYVGATLQFNTSLPLWYKHAWTWQDNTISHATNMFCTLCLSYNVQEKPPDPLFVATPPVCLLYYPASPDTLSPVKCSDLFTFTFACEFEVGNRFSQDQQTFSITVPNPTVKKIRSTTPTIVCPEGHVTYDFLSCDPGSRCGVRQYLAECSTRTGGVMPKFVCSTSNVTIPYTFVCDAKPHCLDGSYDRTTLNPFTASGRKSGCQ